MKKSSPAVSVIIPVYNAERYLGVCLESLLIQTLTDFEVIVVDDCSTDASPVIAESYLERFGGRLKIVTTEKNSGSGGYVPRNIGLNFARGEYIHFVDADDLLIDEALETFHQTAEDFQADVVYPEAFFTCDAQPVPSQIYAAPWNPKLTVNEPTLESDDFAERVRKFTDIQVRWTPWGKFVRRDLLLANEIKFLPLRTFADGIWTLELLCFAKRWLRLPTPLYIYRISDASINNRPRAPQASLRWRARHKLLGKSMFSAHGTGLREIIAPRSI